MQLNQFTEEDRNKIITMRHKLHQYPELSHNESKTKRLLLEEVEKMGLLVTEVDNSNGFFADLIVSPDASYIALRADMDGLPITEENDVPYRSKNISAMHACGHDGHMSVVFGAMLLLVKNRDKLIKNVRFIFQPAEEEATVGGAREMIKAGCLNKVDFIAGLHMWPEIGEGNVGYRKGPFFSGLNKFSIEVSGGNTHTARPDLSAPNSIYIATQIISSIDLLINRRTYPWAPYTVNAGKIEGTPRRTVINGIIAHTVSSRMNPAIAPKLDYTDVTSMLKNIAESVARAAGAEATVTILEGYPPLVTDAEATDKAIMSIEKVFGAGSALESSMTFGGEDFSLYLEQVPGTYLLLGSYNEKKGFTHMIHTPKFNFNDELLPMSAQLLAELINKAMF